MSVVYQAENLRLNNVIALKVLAPELAADDMFRARFLEESRIAASLNHPNVIPIYDMGSQDELLYIAMRYVSGTDLRQIIKKRGRLQPETALFLLGQVARALDAAHRQGLVHRDVKPGNMLIERGSDEGDPDHVYLADFGITKHAMSRTGLTSTGQFLGTIDYVAPEQIRGTSVLGLADQEQGGFGQDPAPLLDHLPHVGPRDVPHRDVQQILVRAHVVDGDHVRVVQRGRDPRLLQEPGPEHVVGGQLGRQHLQRDDVVQAEVLGLVDHAHPTAAEHRANPVAGELVSYQGQLWHIAPSWDRGPVRANRGGGPSVLSCTEGAHSP